MAGRGRGRGGRSTSLSSPGTGTGETPGESFVAVAGLIPAPRSSSAPMASIEHGISSTRSSGRNYQELTFMLLSENVQAGAGYLVQRFGSAGNGDDEGVVEFEEEASNGDTSVDELDMEDPKSHPIPMPVIQPLIRSVKLDHIIAPDNFFIKPSGSIPSPFNTMQSKLNYWYNENNGSVPCLRIGDLVAGGHYVVFSETDGTWHRVMVKALNADGSVCVQLCDDGGLWNTPVKNLRQLRKLFCKLPMQAFHASLQMVAGDAWTPEEVNLFKEEVSGREFRSVVIESRMDPEFAPFQTVGIVLLEVTTGGQSVYNFGERLNIGYSFGKFTPGN